MTDFLEATNEVIKCFNQNYASALSAITPILLGIISYIYFKLYKESKLKEGDAAIRISPTFWSIRRKYIILAAHLMEKDDGCQSGYKNISQNSRPDQWKKIITIERKYLCFLKVSLINKQDIVTVVISKNRKEKWKNIHFNQ